MDNGEDLFARVVAGICCTGIWLLVASGGGWLAHRRVERVETTLGVRAEPPHEGRLLWYAGAATFWPAAASLAVAGLIQRDRARVGRDCTFILLGHFTLAVLGSAAMAAVGPAGSAGPLPMIIYACVLAGTGLVAAPALTAVWALKRARRVALDPPTGSAPGGVRYVMYAGSILLWPLGVILAIAYQEPQNIRVGAIALCLSLAQISLIVITTCAALPILAGMYMPV